jgi:Na+-transporting NADH:ubiquinone oxidoreductase subunit C
MSETAGRTITVAAVLCGVCSVMVAGAVVMLKPKQDFNRDLDFKKNILKSAGLLSDGADINAIYAQNVTSGVIDVSTGGFVEGIDATKYSQSKADKDAALVENIPADKDPANIKRRAKYQQVFIIKKDGALDQVVLHVYGKGLWSTMKGFLSVDKDGNTIRGFNYYAHGETPGLGGEVDNPKWISQWAGKKLFDDSGEYRPKTKVLKGSVNPQDPNAAYQIDGLSGATLTSVGIEGTFKYWIGEEGYGKFLAKLRNGEIQ